MDNEGQEEKKRRPFHETIIDAIDESTLEGLAHLAQLIKATRIPKNHDAIIAAWNQRRQEEGLDFDDDFDLGVTADLLEQKKEAEEGAKDKKSMGDAG